jgi:hypothetical protein
MPEEQRPKLRELVVRASSDADFAIQVLNNPESVADEYNLGPAQIDQIRDLVNQGVFQPAVEAHAQPADYES